MFGNNLKRNKKGSLIDIVFIGVVLLVFSMTVLVGLMVANEVEKNIDINPIFEGTEARHNVESVRVKYTNTIDNTFLFLVIFISLGTLVLAALVRIHPMFIPFYFIGWVIVVFLSGIFSNMYQRLAAGSPEMVEVALQLTFMSKIMAALPFIIGVVGMILMVVMYKIYSAAQI